jgi:hypothetical protein
MESRRVPHSDVCDEYTITYLPISLIDDSFRVTIFIWPVHLIQRIAFVQYKSLDVHMTISRPPDAIALGQRCSLILVYLTHGRPRFMSSWENWVDLGARSVWVSEWVRVSSAGIVVLISTLRMNYLDELCVLHDVILVSSRPVVSPLPTHDHATRSRATASDSDPVFVSYHPVGVLRIFALWIDGDSEIPMQCKDPSYQRFGVILLHHVVFPL